MTDEKIEKQDTINISELAKLGDDVRIQTLKMSSGFQVLVPAEVRNTYNIEPGDYVKVVFVGSVNVTVKEKVKEFKQVDKSE